MADSGDRVEQKIESLVTQILNVSDGVTLFSDATFFRLSICDRQIASLTRLIRRSLSGGQFYALFLALIGMLERTL